MRSGIELSAAPARAEASVYLARHPRGVRQRREQLAQQVRPWRWRCRTPVLGPATIFGALIGGLFGPIGIVAYALVFSAPAWIALGITARIQRGRTNVRPAESA